MPWSAVEFRRKHNRKLSLAEAGKAAAVAGAMIERGVDEGVAIATGNKRAKVMGKMARRRARQLRG